MAPDRRVLLANSVYHLTNDAAVVVMAGQITVLRGRFGFEYFETGLLTAVALVVTIVFQIVFGHLSDRRDPSRFLGLAIGFLGITTAGIALADSFGTLLLLVAIARVGSSAYHPVGISWIGRSFAGEHLDTSMGFQSSFGDIGVILGTASGALLGSAFGWQAPFLLWGAMNVLASVSASLYLRGRPRPPPEPAVRVDYVSILKDVRYWLVPIAVGGAAFNVILTFGPVLVKDKFGQGDAFAGVAISLWILAGSIAAFYFGRLSRRFGRYRALLGAYTCLTVATFAVATAGMPLALPVLWTLGSALFITYPATFSYISQSSRAPVQGAAFGIVFAFQLIGGASAVYTSGFLAERLGDDPSIPFFLASALCGGCLLYLLTVRGRVVPAAGLPVPPAAPS